MGLPGNVDDMEANQVIHGDCLDIMRSMPDGSVDLVFCSPPYEAARTYGIDYKLRGQDWVDWCVARYIECVRLSKGLVAWVVEGQTRNYRYSAVPALLMADLDRRGVNLRKPPIFKRVGIPGSGGPDWLRNDWEWIICATQPGKLPWSHNTAMGHPPKWAPGGEISHRTANGSRVNDLRNRDQLGGTGHASSGEGRKTNGEFKTRKSKRPKSDRIEPKVQNGLTNGIPEGAKFHTKHNGELMRDQLYIPPKLANPGNVIECIVGGGVMGHPLCHENEAPFPEDLAEFFIRSFCPPAGIVLDPFSGSGTTASVAVRTGRQFIAIDVRESQVDLTRRRLGVTQKELIA